MVAARRRKNVNMKEEKRLGHLRLLVKKESEPYILMSCDRIDIIVCSRFS
jgi:hypothetical protein